MNILVLTTIYPEPDDGNLAPTTPVVHNFAKEWVKQGHNVLAIHNSNKFPLIYYYIPSKILAILSSKVGFNIKLIKSQRKDIYSNCDGVKIFRCNIFKYIPFGSYSLFRLNKQNRKILSILKKEDFIPDIIVAHAENPQIYQLYELKKRFPNSITALTLHGIYYLDKIKFKKWKNVYLKSIDRIGFRSKTLMKDAKKWIDFEKNSYICPSGIADECVKQEPNFFQKFSDNKNYKFIFVGQLILRKHADKVIIALAKCFPNKNFSLKIVGNGGEEEHLKKIVDQYDLNDNVIFYGQLSHNRVLELMNESDCFIMISEQEVFGLVYFEAMSQGCIVIASSNEGMDGIITNKVDGFLCNAGDEENLELLLNDIILQPLDNLHEIAKNGYKLASGYTESRVAYNYLSTISRKEGKQNEFKNNKNKNRKKN